MVVLKQTFQTSEAFEGEIKMVTLQLPNIGKMISYHSKTYLSDLKRSHGNESSVKVEKLFTNNCITYMIVIIG